MQIPEAPKCAVHGIDCYLVEADIVNKRTKRFIHTHDETPPSPGEDDKRRFVCPSACEVCIAETAREAAPEA